MVDATRDALENMDTSLEDVIGTDVLPSLRVFSARDALENNWDLHEEVDGAVTSTRDAFDIVAPLANVVALVT